MRSPWLRVGATILVVAALLYFGCRWLLGGEWYSIAEEERSNSYAYGDPSLSGSRDPKLAAYVRGAVDAYLKCEGISPSGAHDLRFAFKPWTLLVRFRLSSADLRRYLRGKKRVAGTVPGLHEDLDNNGYAFFSRLGWWPIPTEQAAQYDGYTRKHRRASAYWRENDEYTLLANPQTGIVYVIAFLPD